MPPSVSFFRRFCLAYRKSLSASLAWKCFVCIAIVGIYAPIFASSKPLLVRWHSETFSPLLRYLFFPGFYTKPLDLFFNVFMVVFPFVVLSFKFLRGWVRKVVLCCLMIGQCVGFAWVLSGHVQDPAASASLKKLRAEKIQENMTRTNIEAVTIMPKDIRTWEMERRYMSTYEQLGILIKFAYRQRQDAAVQKYRVAFEGLRNMPMPTLRNLEKKNEKICLERLQHRLQKLQESHEDVLCSWKFVIDEYRPYLMSLLRIQHELNLALYHEWEQPESLIKAYADIERTAEPYRQNLLQVRKILEEHAKLQGAENFIRDKLAWIEKESQNMKILIHPLFSCFHWEDDAGGSREMNKHVAWWQLTRINRKDLLSSLIFGIRIALVVGGIGVAIAFTLGIIIGLISGYFGGAVDMALSRFTEIWETMPMLFILMLVISITQKKSLILDTVLLGCFGWTGFSRYIRVETLKQRNMAYVLAARNLGYSHYHIMVHQILPNAIVPVISLLPFSIMAMISCEAGLTFLGLGEESSASWGNLMREGVAGFPSESAILWPPAFMLTVLLVVIALIGDGVRDALDPRVQD